MATHVSQVLSKARSAVDMVNSLFCTNDEFLNWISDGAKALYDILVEKYGHHYFLSSTQITADGTNEEFALPADFSKLTGVDYLVDSASGQWSTVRPFNFPERNKVDRRNFPLYGGEARYRIQNNKLRLLPKPTAGAVYRVWYIPKFVFASDVPRLVAEPLITVDGEITKPYNVSLLGALSGSTEYTLTFRHEKVGSDYFWEVYRDGVYLNRATVNSLPTDVALSSIDASLTGLTLRVEQGQGQSGPYASKCSWTFTSGANSNYLPEAFDPWLEYLEAYAAVQALNKEESDPTPQMERLKNLAKRIEHAAENRDAGMPLTVADTWHLDDYEDGNVF